MPRRSRLHKVVHRATGGAMAAVAAVSVLMGVDLTPLFGADAAAKIMAATALIVAGLEFLPAIDAWMADTAEDDEHDPPVDLGR